MLSHDVKPTVLVEDDVPAIRIGALQRQLGTGDLSLPVGRVLACEPRSLIPR